MKKSLVCITFIFIFNSFLYAELTRAQMWAISLTGIMTEINRSNRNSLNTSTMDVSGRNIWLEVLSRDWGITTREELLETLERMEYGGHAASFREIQEIIYEVNKAQNEQEIAVVFQRYQWDQTKYNRFIYVYSNWDRYYNRTLKSWDLGRNISLCRWGYNVGFLSDKEAWDKIFHYARIIQTMYSSFEEYGLDYFMGRLFWASGFEEQESYFTRTEPIYKQLMESYWNWLDWDINLDQIEKEAPPLHIARIFQPEDNSSTAQFLTNDPAMYNRYHYRYMPNPNSNPNVYESTVMKVSGSRNTGYGILFCIDDTDSNDISFYRLYISVNGMFTVAKYTESRWAVAPVSWRDSQLINTGFNTYNTLRVERIDNEDRATFMVFLNGSLAVEFVDSDPINGNRAGLAVSIDRMEMEMFPYIPVDVRFDF